MTERIQFLGPYTRIAAPLIFQSADAYISLNYNDSCPNCVLEALACGLPVIYSDSGGTPELVSKHCGVPLACEKSWEVQCYPEDRLVGPAMVVSENVEKMSLMSPVGQLINLIFKFGWKGINRYLVNLLRKQVLNFEFAGISVLTTVDKGREFLKECVNSVQSQSFENWEHIIVSDGATDDIVCYLEQLSDPRQRIFLSSKIGRSRALNLGIQNCSTDLIAILDADDIAHPRRLQIQFDKMQSLPAASALSSKCVLTNFKGQNIDLPTGDEFEMLPKSRELSNMSSATIISKTSLIDV